MSEEIKCGKIIPTQNITYTGECTQKEWESMFDELESRLKNPTRQSNQRDIYCGKKRLDIFLAEKKRLKEIRPNEVFSDEAIFYGLTKTII